MSDEISDRVFAALNEIANAGEQNSEAVFALWKQLRKTLARQERYASAPWVLPVELRNRLGAARDRLVPSDPPLLYHWLFDHAPDLPDVNPGKDLRAYEAALRDARLSALRQIESSCGADCVFRLLGLSKAVNTIGWMAGEEKLLSVGDIGLPTVFDSTDEQRLTFTNAYLLCRHHREGWNFTNTIPTTDWSSRQLATFARCLPFGSETWEWLQSFGVGAVREYWSHVRGFLRQANLGQVVTACRSLINVARPFASVDVLHSAVHDGLSVSSDLIAEVLEATFTVSSSEKGDVVNDVSYDIQQLVGTLQRDNSFDRMRIARIEWGLLPVLDQETSEAGPSTLVSTVLSSPEFFVQLLSTTHHAENAPPPTETLSEQDQLRARYAHDLLNRLVTLPGTDDNGMVDYGYFRSWADEVRLRAAACDRVDVCDSTLAELIVRASMSPDRNWPTPEVATFMEAIGADSLFKGFEIAVLNGRGAVSQSLWEGGVQERSLAARYRDLAEYVRPYSPKLAESFLRLAGCYDAYARHEDEEAERRKLGR